MLQGYPIDSVKGILIKMFSKLEDHELFVSKVCVEDCDFDTVSKILKEYPHIGNIAIVRHPFGIRIEPESPFPYYIQFNSVEDAMVLGAIPLKGKTLKISEIGGGAVFRYEANLYCKMGSEVYPVDKDYNRTSGNSISFLEDTKVEFVEA